MLSIISIFDLSGFGGTGGGSFFAPGLPFLSLSGLAPADLALIAALDGALIRLIAGFFRLSDLFREVDSTGLFGLARMDAVLLMEGKVGSFSGIFRGLCSPALGLVSDSVEESRTRLRGEGDLSRGFRETVLLRCPSLFIGDGLRDFISIFSPM